MINDKELIALYDRLEVLAYRNDPLTIPDELANRVLKTCYPNHVEFNNPVMIKYAAVKIAKDRVYDDMHDLAVVLAQMASREFARYGSQPVADRLVEYAGTYDWPKESTKPAATTNGLQVGDKIFIWLDLARITVTSGVIVGIDGTRIVYEYEHALTHLATRAIAHISQCEKFHI